jgi:ATP-dependent protease HslVU (ClpYQ) peptidase subunit
VCGNLRYLDILKYRFRPPKTEENQSIIEYLNTIFIDEIRSCLEKSKYSEEKDGTSEVPGNSRILIGYKNKIYSLGPCYDIVEIIDYYVVGSGADYAMGSLETMRNSNLDPKERIELALKVACKFDSACAAPFLILEGIP